MDALKTARSATLPATTMSISSTVADADDLHQIIIDLHEHAQALKWASSRGEQPPELLSAVFTELSTALTALTGAETLIREQQQTIQEMHTTLADADKANKTNSAQDMRDTTYQETLARLTAERVARLQAETDLRDQVSSLSIAAHECKTPLTTILGQAQLMQERATRAGMRNDADQHALNVIAAQAHRLNTQIDTMLNRGQIAAGQFTIVSAPLDIVELVRRVASLLEPTLQDHTLHVSLPDQPLVILGDAVYLQQVLENLISNAAKYSPHHSAITLYITQQQGSVSLHVRDQGIGIPDAAHQHLFQQFYRVHQAQSRHARGQGIGLYVVKAIVEAHGGSVTLASAEGKGSTFTVTLPLAETTPNHTRKERRARQLSADTQRHAQRRS